MQHGREIERERAGKENPVWRGFFPEKHTNYTTRYITEKDWNSESRLPLDEPA